MGRMRLVAIGIAVGVVAFASIVEAQTDPSRGELETRQAEIESELKSLIDRIGELTERGTEIEERQEYVERILELRDQLEVLGPKTPLPFRLVEIDGPPDDPGYSAGATGYSYTFKRQVSLGNQPFECEYYGSYRVASAPTVILPGRAFELEMESIVEATGHYCTPTENRIAIFLGALDRVHLVTPAQTQSKSRLTLRLEPICSGRDDRWAGDLLFFYRVEATSSSDSGDIDIRVSAPEGITKDLDCARQIEAAGDRAMYISAMSFLPERGVYRGDYHAQSSNDGATIRLQFKFSSWMVGSIDLVYRTVNENGSWIAVLPAYKHPEDLLRPPREGSSDTLAAKQEPLGPEEAPELAPIPAPVPVPAPASQSRNERLRTSTVFATPETAADDLPGSPDASPPTALRVADVVSLPAQSAKTALESDGFAVDIEVGAPAHSRIDAFRVASQIPAAGIEAKPGDRIRLTIHGDWVAPTVGVPDLFGLQAAEAKRLLANQGLTADISVGAAARRVEDEFTVSLQVPSPMTEADRGDTVRVTIHGRYEAPQSTVDTTQSDGSLDRSPGRSTQGQLPGKGPVSWNTGSLHRGPTLRDFQSGAPQECRQACSVDERCVGFNWGNFTPPAWATGPLAKKLPSRCRLLAGITGKMECQDPGLECVSGVKEGSSLTTGGGESSSEPNVTGLEGVWQSTWGPIDFSVRPDGTVRGSYGRRNGRIVGNFDGRVLEGVWVKDIADQCSTRRDGSGYWGRARFELDPQTGEFAGVYGNCDGPMTSKWKIYR